MGEIFSLLVLTCVYGNSTGCNQAGNAAYLTTPLPNYIEYANKEYKTFSGVVGALGLAKEKRINANIGYNFSTTLDWKQELTVEYIRWNYNF